MVLRVKFDDSWAGLNKYATWTDAQANVGDQTIITELDRADDENAYDIPVSAFVTQYAGTVKLSFTGYAVGGTADNLVESVINTAAGSFRVLESTATRLDGGNVNATLAEQLTDTVNKCTKRVAAAEGKIEEFEEAEDGRKEAELERKAAENGYTDEDGNFVPGRVQNEDKRVDAERQRQINEFGAEGNRYDSDLGYVVNADGVKVENDQAGRVGAEIQRQIDENKRISNETSREERFSEMEKLVGDLPEAVEAILALQESLIGGDEQ
jgi:hypothetical protein